MHRAWARVLMVSMGYTAKCSISPATLPAAACIGNGQSPCHSSQSRCVSCALLRKAASPAPRPHEVVCAAPLAPVSPLRSPFAAPSLPRPRAMFAIRSGVGGSLGPSGAPYSLPPSCIDGKWRKTGHEDRRPAKTVKVSPKRENGLWNRSLKTPLSCAPIQRHMPSLKVTNWDSVAGSCPKKAPALYRRIV